MTTLTKVRQFFTSPSVPAWKKLFGVAAVVYVISPLDILPDAMPVIGWLDDVGVLGLLWAAIAGTKGGVEVIDGEVVKPISRTNGYARRPAQNRWRA
jgi:uncharacterized membrane protein YkvA (DUF1232 family)